MTNVSVTTLWDMFSGNKQFNTVAILIAADFLFGVAAALKGGTFRVQAVTKFFFDDVLVKVLPWFLIFAFGVVNHGTVIAGYGTFADISDAMFVGVVASMTASLVKSFAELGVPVPAGLVSLAGANPFKAGVAYMATDGDDRAAYVGK